jgi:4-aminobutyrate aminotransferase-like enzyme
MTESFPGPKTKTALQRGIPLFKNGLRFDQEVQKAGSRGFRSVRQIVIDRAAGDYVWDLDGKRYIDFQNGWATNPLGNCHPEILEVVEAANRRYGFHYDHPLRYDLAERLADIMPRQALPRTNYEVSGTEAAEAAVHLALTHTRRRYVVTFGASYHGNSLAGKILSGLSGEASAYLEGWGGGVIRAPYPFSDDIPADMTPEQYVDFCLWYLEKQIPETVASADNIAAVLIEPGLAEGGNWIPSTGFIQGLRAVCDRNDWLLISDEVLTGVGRTGRMWAIEHYDVVPDILIYGKNLSGGIAPLAGISARDEILGDNPLFNSGSTFAGAPAGCAAAIKTLDIYERDGVLALAEKLGRIAREIMAEWERYDIVRQVRGNGLLLGVSFHATGKIHQDAENWWAARAVRGEMLERGVWAISDHEDTIRLYPALNMDEEVLRAGLGIMEEAIQTVERGTEIEGDGACYPTGVAGF